MAKAYIILAHKNLAQVNRLIKKLDDNSSYFFVHIDKKVPREFLTELIELPGKMWLVERLNTKWAGISLVQATLSAMTAVKQTGIAFDAVMLLSGQDYPVKSNEEIDEFIRTSNHSILMEYSKLPNYEKWQDAGGMYRVNKYYMGLKFRERYTSKALNFLSMIFPFIKRKMPGNMQPYVGSQWWSIDMYTLEYILSFVKTNPAYLAFNKFTFAPDESFFHTIVLNAKDPRIRGNILNDNKRFMIWKTFEMSHPEILNEAHLQDLLQSDALFARKFDMDKHPGFFDEVDRHVQGRTEVTSERRLYKRV